MASASTLLNKSRPITVIPRQMHRTSPSTSPRQTDEAWAPPLGDREATRGYLSSKRNVRHTHDSRTAPATPPLQIEHQVIHRLYSICLGQLSPSSINISMRTVPPFHDVRVPSAHCLCPSVRAEDIRYSYTSGPHEHRLTRSAASPLPITPFLS